jgi:hypothetical protein
VTQQTTPAHDKWPWDAMIETFRMLGGVAENIAPGEHGLLAVDPSKPVLIRVPPDLLMRVQDISVVNGRVVLDASADVPVPARRFFDRYANALDLSAVRTAQIFSFVSALAALPANVREVLATDLGLGPLLRGDPDEGIRSHFLRARQVIWREDRAIAPVIELAGYDPSGLRPERGTNLQIQGYVRNEVFVRFASQDAYSAFRLFGRAVPEASAFSLATTVNFEQFQINIGRKLIQGAKRGKDRVPNISRDGQKVSLSYLLLGHRKAPAQPRSVFRALLSEAGIGNPDEAFDRIVRSNALRFIKLLRKLEPHEGELISTLRTMARYQLEALYHCVGTRVIAPAEND